MLLRSIFTVSFFTLLSRVLGFVRDVVTAAFLGAGPLADAFFVAFKLPNFLRRLFAEGAFNAGFVPLFAGTVEAEGNANAKRLAEEAQAVLAAVLIALVAAAILGMPWLIRLFAPGFAPDSVQYQATVDLARITFPYILFISLVALLGGVLNSLGRFAAPAATPIVLNLALIAALLALTPWLPSAAHALAVGVAVGGLCQWLWLIVAAQRLGMAPRLQRPRITPRIKRLFALILPGVFGASIAQINLLADVIFASFLPAGSISYLYYADRLNQLPLGVIGAAIGTALLPLLARQIRAEQTAAAQHSQNRALEVSTLLSLPAAAALFVIGGPIISVLFQRGAFAAEDVAPTVAALQAYALGLPAFVLIKVLAPGFFARQDTKTPVKIASLCLISNIGFTLLLIGPLQHVGIALASTFSNWLNAVLLAVLLIRRDLFVPDARLKRVLPRLLLATLIMALSLGLLLRLDGLLPGVVLLLCLCLLGLLVFAASAQLCGATDWREMRRALRPPASAEADRA